MSEQKPTHLRIRFRGKRSGGQWVYVNPRTVPLPIPFVSYSERAGEVVCDPIGTFSYEDGQKILEMSGENGPFVLEEAVYADGKPEVAEPQAVSPRLEVVQPERYQPSMKYLRHKKRGRPFVKKPASLPETPQAVAEENAPIPA